MGKSLVLLSIVAGAAIAGCQFQETAEPVPANEVAPPANDVAAPAIPAAPAPTVVPAAAEAPLVKNAADTALQWGPCPAPLPTGCELAVLHGDPAKPNADVLLRLPGGGKIPPHRHSSAERMILVAGQMEVKYQGTAAATLNPGNYAYGPANLPHRANCTGVMPCTLFIAFEGPVDVVPVEGEIK